MLTMFGLMSSAPSSQRTKKTATAATVIAKSPSTTSSMMVHQQVPLGGSAEVKIDGAVRTNTTTTLMMACIHNLEHDVRVILLKKVRLKQGEDSSSVVVFCAVKCRLH